MLPSSDSFPRRGQRKKCRQAAAREHRDLGVPPSTRALHELACRRVSLPGPGPGDLEDVVVRARASGPRRRRDRRARPSRLGCCCLRESTAWAPPPLPTATAGLGCAWPVRARRVPDPPRLRLCDRASAGHPGDVGACRRFRLAVLGGAALAASACFAFAGRESRSAPTRGASRPTWVGACG